MSQSRATAPDGAAIAIETFGSGPGLVVINGGGVSAKKARAIVIPKTRHDAPNMGRPAFVEPFDEFL